MNNNYSEEFITYYTNEDEEFCQTCEDYNCTCEYPPETKFKIATNGFQPSRESETKALSSLIAID